MERETSVGLSCSGSVAILQIDNPPLNILTVAVREALFRRIIEVENRPDIRVVVVQAGGSRAFSVGSDIREFPDDELGGVAKIRFEQYLLDRLAGLPAVTIAKVGGMALGGGAELMLACDFRIASTGAEIGFPEIRLGALPAAGGMKRLTREIGSLYARELVLLGRPVSATRAAEIGLINSVVPAEDLDAEVDRLARELVALPAEAMRLAKRVIGSDALWRQMDTEEAEAFGILFRGTDLAEGLAAFLEKREPRFNR